MSLSPNRSLNPMNLSDCVIPRKVEIPDGAYGVWQIPELDIVIPLYKGVGQAKTQAIVDKANSASIRQFGAGRVIEDHAESKAGQGRWQIGRVTPDMVGFLILPDKTEQYICNRVLRAYRHSSCYTCDGVGIYPRSATDILCICCAKDDATEVYIAAFKYKCKMP